MAVAKGAGLPNHVAARDWEPLQIDPFEAAALDADTIADIEERGFSFYKLCRVVV